MGNQIILLLFSVYFFLNCLRLEVLWVSGQCLDDQKELLLQLKNNIKFDPSSSTKLVQWDEIIDCCQWRGVSCEDAGDVIGLDLNSESISGQLNDSSTLFHLRFLQTVNLANNFFDSADLPSRFGQLLNLRYLNLSNSRFSGQIPREFSLLTRLTTLDLSATSPGFVYSLRLENPSLTMLVQNLTVLRELHLDGVNVSASGHDWCQAISSSLPNLELLSMSNCHLSGLLCSSLAKLQSLSVIRLDGNTFSAPFPNFFTNFSNLTVLSLSSCDLNGTVPKEIFQLPSLQKIDLSNNRLLEGLFPEFPKSGPLQILVLSYTNFSGKLPNSTGNLRMLSRIDIRSCNFSGQIPNSLEKLTQLVSLDLSLNAFTGSIPSFCLSKNLTTINLYYNRLTGAIPSSHWEGLDNLAFLDLGDNLLRGIIPLSLFTLPSLEYVNLSNNQFSEINELPYVPSSKLAVVDLSSNNMQGPIPFSLFEIRSIVSLSLSSNNFSGQVELSRFEKLLNLISLDLSYNKLVVSPGDRKSSLPQLDLLKLASCRLQELPDLKNQTHLMTLDLSNNQISGEIPNWIWGIGLRFVNLSHNLFTHLQEPYEFQRHDFLDLHSNLLHKIPLPPRAAAYVDYSNNDFDSSLPDDIGNYLVSAFFLSISHGKLVGVIPQSICNATHLKVLDLSNNNLNGTIPSCVIGMSKTLVVLTLHRNKLTGNISGMFSEQCALETLDLSVNLLEGKVPPSLVYCTKMEHLNLGDNKFNDTFPYWLNKLCSLRVLVLRSNSFHGRIKCLGSNNSWPNLQIMDLSSNNFCGILSAESFLNFGAMKIEIGEAGLDYLSFRAVMNDQFYCRTIVTFIQGQGLVLEKIITILTSIDFSSNSFQGRIPETIGCLKSLYLLNLSHNVLTGPIPPSVGNLKELGSLDLSFNKLSGEIPSQIAGLTFLSVLNLSYNQLSGLIPRGPQIQSFSSTSFEGNRLCGTPLMKNCSGGGFQIVKNI